MENVRKEISEFVKWGDVLLYGKASETPLTVEELTLL